MNLQWYNSSTFASFNRPKARPRDGALRLYTSQTSFTGLQNITKEIFCEAYGFKVTVANAHSKTTDLIPLASGREGRRLECAMVSKRCIFSIVIDFHNITSDIETLEQPFSYYRVFFYYGS
jgi:hypothetical protein